MGEVTFWTVTFIHHELFIVFQIQVNLHQFVYKLVSRLSTICDRKQDFTNTLLSLVADDTDSVSKILMMMYIDGNKSWFVTCSIEQYLWLIIYKSPPNNFIHKIMEDIYMCIPVVKQRIALYKKKLSNLCINTCLLDTKEAMVRIARQPERKSSIQ